MVDISGISGPPPPHHHQSSSSSSRLPQSLQRLRAVCLSCPVVLILTPPPHPSSDHFSHSTESLKRDGLRKHLQQHRSTRCNALTQLTLSLVLCFLALPAFRPLLALPCHPPKYLSSRATCPQLCATLLRNEPPPTLVLVRKPPRPRPSGGGGHCMHAWCPGPIHWMRKTNN